MKVLLATHFFPPGHPGGTEAYTLGLAKTLRSIGHSPFVICAERWGEGNDWVPTYEDTVYEGIPVRCFSGTGKPGPGSIRQLLRQPRDGAVLHELHAGGSSRRGARHILLFPRIWSDFRSSRVRRAHCGHPDRLPVPAPAPHSVPDQRDALHRRREFIRSASSASRSKFPRACGCQHSSLLICWGRDFWR